VNALAEASYLAELTRRTGDALRGRLVGVYAGGSWALGDYLRGRSDLDVAVVCEASPSGESIGALARRLRHDSLPCPARGLELVVYTRAVATAGRAEPGFELNLNTGARMTERAERRGDIDESHWFAIDRSILAQHGRALAGPPARAVFRSPPRAVVLGLIATSLRWHAGQAAALDDAVLNAARSVVYARAGTWTSKSAAARRLIEQGEWADLLRRALALRGGGAVAVDPDEAREFGLTAARIVADAGHADTAR
jgi:hypothetical protein